MNVTTTYSGTISSVTSVIGLGSDIRLKATTSAIDGDLDVSPVTLSSDWPRVGRLSLLIVLASLGSLGNIFMISAVVVEDQLSKRGNAFLVNVALADLLVTGLVMPVSMIVILAGHEESLATCRFESTLEILCFLVTILTLATIAGENYARLCTSAERYASLTVRHVTTMIIAIWLVAVIVVVLQSQFDLGPDFCRRRINSISMEQAVGAGVLVGLPVLIVLVLYAKLVIYVRRVMRGPYKPPITFSWDYELTKANIFSCQLFALFWLPFGLAMCINSFKSINPRVFYHLSWFALSKSCLNCVVYCLDRHFRCAYIKLFHYCCCKTSVSFSRRPRGGEGGRNSSDVRLRVHIIHSYASPSSCRPTVARPNGRDVYEL
ncbi:hypothetical protein DMN91_008935 [Ooceraea biroi]|uniref:Beta-3 adrenergic receptor n=2 Tax=Ooceraea biroi TaxID=2015173 RepID=A0A026WKA3_OOCBI|nr:beta-1 adrenergic receptor isoform X1 [Ooceraea biroi]XP_011336812.1 beta-1 adrenergic receptor isoform X1 [Ooceraea biroi]EZA55529.1 Beta-3 adrenergic receptor [Ooceraea biroi]RLU18578.1 hypothetical protein DMN91_008935 [Ooceraea biroi]